MLLATSSLFASEVANINLDAAPVAITVNLGGHATVTTASEERLQLLRVPLNVYDTCDFTNLAGDEKRIAEVGDRRKRVYVLLNNLSAELEGIANYHAGRTYYFVTRGINTDNQPCLNGQKFAITAARVPSDSEKEINRLKEVERQLKPQLASRTVAREQARLRAVAQRRSELDEIRFLREQAQQINPHIGDFVVRSFHDGRVGLRYLNGEPFNQQNIPAYNNQVQWVVKVNGQRLVATGRFEWTDPAGRYAFLIREDTSLPYPKINDVLIVRSIF